MAEQIFGSQGLRNYQWFSIPNPKMVVRSLYLEVKR